MKKKKRQPPFVVVGLDSSTLSADAKKHERTWDFKIALTEAVEARVGRLPRKWRIPGTMMESDMNDRQARFVLNDFLENNPGGDRTIRTNGVPVCRCRMTPTGWKRECSFTVLDGESHWTCKDAIKRYENPKGKRRRTIKKGRRQLWNLKIELIVVSDMIAPE